MNYYGDNDRDSIFDRDGYYSMVPQEPRNRFAPAPGPELKPKKKRGWAKAVALALSCTILGGAMGAGGFYLGSKYQSGGDAPLDSQVSTMVQGVRESSLVDVAHIDTGKAMSPAEVYAANVNSTVGIQTSITTNFFGYQTTSAAAGSGFIITDDGYILTNYHVVENSSSINVTLYDGTSYAAGLVGYDESNDIAVLKVDAQGLTPVILGDSDNMNVGDTVVAIGNPLGELTFSLTSGSISALNREVTISGNITMNLIQTDCAINSGNSGGALFNLYGEVIGITNAKYSGSGSNGEASIDNIGFAIPLNSIRSIAQSIIEKGYITKPYIGVKVTNVGAESQSLGLPAGAAVAEVTEDGPAAQAGLRANDIITKIDGEDISGSSDLVARVNSAAPGDKLALTVYRQGEPLQLELTIGEQTKSALENQEAQDGQQQDQQQQQQEQGSFPSGFGFPY